MTAPERPITRLRGLVAACATPPPGRARIALALLYGAVTHLTFVAGVGAMMFAMFFGLSRSFGTVAWPWSLLANACLVLQFPLLHSLLLGRVGRRLLNRIVPGPHGRVLATSTYALIASVQLLALFTLWSPSGVIWWQAQGAVFVMLCLAYAAAWLLLLKAILDAGMELQIGALGWMSLLQNIPVRFPDMPQDGLFRLIRQPIYVAFSATLWTVPVWTPDQLVLAVSFTAYCVLAPRLKEARFTAIHGDRFRAYQARVPYMIPYPWPQDDKPRNDLTIYNTVADRWWSDDVRWVRTLKNMVPARLRYFDGFIGWQGARVLDLGCAGGFMAEAMAQRGARVTGIDPAADAIAAAAVHAKVGGLAITYDVGSGEALPYGDESFDAVVCVDVLEHVTDLRRVLAEVSRVLRPDGLFLFDTINRNVLARFVTVTLAESVLGLLPRGTHDPELFITPASVRVKLAEVGLVAGQFTGLGPRGVDRRGDLTFGRWPGTAVIYLGTARKASSDVTVADAWPEGQIATL